MYSLSLSLVSCENDRTADAGQLKAKSIEFPQEECEFEPYALYFDNGVTPNCINNMMHFPSWESYYATLDDLENQIEAHEDAFVAANSTLSDDELTDLEDITGFDANMPLIAFEEVHDFCSLRALVDPLIDDFMNSLPASATDMSQNPDDNQFVDDLDRVLYNEQSEVMVCGYIFKWMKDGILQIDANHPYASQALSYANNSTSSSQDVVDNLNPGGEAPWLIAITPTTSNDGCFYDSKEIQYEFSNGNNTRRIRKYNRLISVGPGGSATGALRFASQTVFKSITKNYRYSRKWKGLRIRSHARIDGEIHDINLGCPNYVYRDVRSTIKKRRVRREKLRIPIIGNGPAVGTGEFRLKSKHLQDQTEYELYFQ